MEIKVKSLKEEIIKDNTKQIVLTLTQNGEDIDIVFEGNGKAKIAALA